MSFALLKQKSSVTNILSELVLPSKLSSVWFDWYPKCGIFFKQLHSALSYLHRLEKLQILATIFLKRLRRYRHFFLNTYDELIVLNAPKSFQKLELSKWFL
jgi:hypothetical protein